MDVQEAQSTKQIGMATALLPPMAVAAFLLLTFFAPILGPQVTEIARLVRVAEIDLKYLFLGNATGEFLSILSKLVIFDALVIVWTFVASGITFAVASDRLSRSQSVILAIACAASVPGILLVKYWGTVVPSNYWLDLFLYDGASKWTKVLLQYLPPFEPGGLWIFSGLVIIQVGLVLWVTARWSASGAGGSDKISIVPIVFWVSIATFVGVALFIRHLPFQTTNILGSANTVVLFSIVVYGFLAGLIFYFHFTVGRTVAFLFLLYMLAIYVFSGIFPEPPKTVSAPVSKALPSEDAFVKWYGSRAAKWKSEEPFPILIVATAGGGMRATMRTLYFLEHMRRTCPKFYRHTFAISSVSGGALGALLAIANAQLEEEIDASKRGSCALQQSSLILTGEQ